MAILKTDYKDFITQVGESREFNVTQNPNGTTKIIDVTDYEQDGDYIGAGALNATNTEVNNGKVVRSLPERRIGTNHDGKPIYTRTYIIAAMPNTTYNYEHNVVNMNVGWVDPSGSYMRLTTNYRTFGLPYSGTSAADGYVDVTVTRTHIEVKCETSRTAYQGEITILYTKTTD